LKNCPLLKLIWEKGEAILEAKQGIGKMVICPFFLAYMEERKL